MKATQEFQSMTFNNKSSHFDKLSNSSGFHSSLAISTGCYWYKKGYWTPLGYNQMLTNLNCLKTKKQRKSLIKNSFTDHAFMSRESESGSFKASISRQDHLFQDHIDYPETAFFIAIGVIKISSIIVQFEKTQNFDMGFSRTFTPLARITFIKSRIVTQILHFVRLFTDKTYSN